jgi:glycosyltransferase involved in cell wall biosynthesis
MCSGEIRMENDICIVIPAYNEEKAIRDTIKDYRDHFPKAFIVVVDNNSSDRTAEFAKAEIDNSKGLVIFEPLQGKGNAVKTGISRVDADIYIMTDGDGTYPAGDAKRLVEFMLENRCDMVVGDRLSGGSYMKQNKRAGHNFGNKFLSKYISSLSGQPYNDVLSGLRIMSRPFISALDVRSSGFQLETELNIIAAYLRASVIELPIEYLSRPVGSYSKLNTYRDGIRILQFAILNWIAFYPLRAFGMLALMAFTVSSILGAWVFYVFFKTGEMPYPSTAVLAAALGLVGLQSIFTGLNLRITGRNTRRIDISRLMEDRRRWNLKLDGITPAK